MHRNEQQFDQKLQEKDQWNDKSVKICEFWYVFFQFKKKVHHSIYNYIISSYMPSRRKVLNGTSLFSLLQLHKWRETDIKDHCRLSIHTSHWLLCLQRRTINYYYERYASSCFFHEQTNKRTNEKKNAQIVWILNWQSINGVFFLQSSAWKFELLLFDNGS